MPANPHNPAVGALLREPPRSALKARSAVVGAGLAAVALAVVAVSDQSTTVASVRTLGVAVRVAVGLFRLTREPTDRFARLLVAVGALWALTTLAESSGSVAYSVGRTSAWLMEPALVFLILTFPHGRIERAAHRRLVVAAAVLVAALYVPSALLGPFPEPSPWASCGTSCPANAFQLNDGTAALTHDVLQPARELLAVALFALVTLAVARRSRSGGPILQRIVAPVVVVAMVRTVALAVYLATRRTGGSSELADALGWVYALSLPALAVAFAIGLVAHRLFVADALERLTQTLSSRPSARELRDALAGALNDPLLTVPFRVPEGPSGGGELNAPPPPVRSRVPESPGGWVGETGGPAGPPTAGPARAVTEARAHGKVLAAIGHDHELLYDRALLGGMSSYTVAALENRQM